MGLVLKNQTDLGGFGENIYTSACEDMDSIELLVELGDKKDIRVLDALRKALRWALYNQNQDGGFVFVKNSKIHNGHENMSAKENESNIFASWFRTLSILKITSFLEIDNAFKYAKTPGC